MRGRFGRGDICLEGSTPELSMLASALEKECVVELCISTGVPPEPYSGWLKSVKSTDGVGKVVICRMNDVLLIKGELKYRAILAENIRFLCEGAHLHVEYYPNHFYLNETSLPLVVECVRGG